MSDIFEEVDDDLRRDKAGRLWARYQNHVFAAAAVAVIGTAAYTGWQIYDRKAREQAGATYLATLQAAGQDPKKAPEILGQLASDGGPFAGLLRFDIAHAALKAGEREKALGVLTATASDSSIESPLRGAAGILGAYVALDLGKNDAAVALATPLLADGQPYRLSALEVTGLAALAGGDRAKAREIYAGLDAYFRKEEEAGTPPSLPNLRDRVAIMLDRLAE